MKCSYKLCEFASVNPERLKKHMSFHDMGLIFDKKIEEDSIDNDAKDTSVNVLNSSMEVKFENTRCDFENSLNFLFSDFFRLFHSY